MKVRILVEAHTEKYKGNLEPLIEKLKNEVSGYNTNEELLVIPGDLGVLVNDECCINEDYVNFLKFLKQHWDNIILVPGNDEYHGIKNPETFEITENALEKICKTLKITYLQKNMTKVGEYYVLGCTLWRYITKKEWSNTMEEDKDMFLNMELYRMAYANHLEWLDDALEYVRYKKSKAIVVTHFPPETTSRFMKNKAYASHIDKFLDIHKDVIKIWISGKYGPDDENVHHHN